MSRTSAGELDVLKVQLKTWERQFLEENGRSPIKEDIKAHPEIRRKYKEYTSLKKLLSKGNAAVTGQKHGSPSRATHPTPQKHIDAEIELGPTPQIYGKVVSLFEMHISPLKKVPVRQLDADSSETCISPDLHSQDVAQSELLTDISCQAKRQLDFSVTPHASPVKAVQPLLLNAPDLRFEAIPHARTKYGPNSPVKFDGDVTLTLSQTPLQAKLAQASEGYSPSPLIKRPAKPLSQLAKEYEDIVEELKEVDHAAAVRNLGGLLQQEEENTQEAEAAEPSATRSDRKRRKNKVRPALVTLEEEIPQGNLHEQLVKLRQKALDKFNGNDPNDSSDEEKKTSATSAKPAKARKRKYNTVSDNFRRLKLPTKNTRNGRWRRR
ncbi:ABL045Wp [Eremothecium gossypii ATCC 10895]|uniref:DNA replication regulator SLD2 n=1 Tax=Eremothecium gossypii (strain ATCC 10895 / CBS 109.51 / FGSC 9923 / NRRL Y-1056) TaxID=284811 RepID=SLD2_EREGS|nr:ABL045Wp [Eremothecium gossypii ATCC 10895]Q75DR2.1 RecName: Full=DNA replication regulator SLD2 [Eremothecium gossypii ATCC 10895]AAS50726.1 ABL045Wp [Eremothecium gossypii ATCC 10895]AEY95015.1 FABL045Wp [Eremothecium gossypii FDAG1]